MPREKIHCKEILRLRDKGLSQDAIAAAVHASKRSVNGVLAAARALSLTYECIKDMQDDEIHGMLFTSQASAELMRLHPDYGMLHTRLAMPGSSLKDEWETFREECRRNGNDSVEYSTFCGGYNSYLDEHGLPSHVRYKYGGSLHCSWGAIGVPVTDGRTAHVFVGLLPASGFVYGEITDGRDEDSFIRCLVHMMESIGGMPRKLEIAHVRRPGARRLNGRDIVLTDRTLGIRLHYGMEICESSDTACIDDLSGTIDNALRSPDGPWGPNDIERAINRRMDARNSVSAAAYREEKKFLGLLPERAYTVTTSHDRPLTVQQNSHVKFRGNYYSVPYVFRGQLVELVYTDNTVELLSEGLTIAVHDKFPAFSAHQYATEASHMPPPGKRPSMDKRWMLRQATYLGLSVRQVAIGIFSRVLYEEQAYNSVQSLIRLGKTVGRTRLNEACAFALQSRQAPGYGYIAEIIKNG